MCLGTEIYFDRTPCFGIFPSFCGMKISSQETPRVNGCHSCPRKLLNGRRRSLRISWSNLKQMKNIYSLIPDKVLFCLNFCLVGYCLMLFNWADHGFQRFWALNLFRLWIHDKELTSRLHMIKTLNKYSLKCNKESISRASNMAFKKKSSTIQL